LLSILNMILNIIRQGLPFNTDLDQTAKKSYPYCSDIIK